MPALDFKGAAVRIHHRGDDKTTLLEIAGEENGEVVNDAVFARNRSVEERLNVKLETIAGDADHERFMSNLKTVLMSGDDVYDIISALRWRALLQAMEGLYYNLADASYIDFDAPWWCKDYMAEIAVGSERFMLAGDISTTPLRNISAMYVNKRIFSDNFGDVDNLYQTILDGNWTHDALRKYVSDVYQDLNNNGLTDDGDLLGISTTPVAQTDHICYSAGLRYTERDSKGMPQLVPDQSRNVKVIETIYNLLYETPGALVYRNSTAPESETFQNFLNGTQLFYPNRIYNAELLREMKDPYGIIPMPKLDDSQKDYISLVHDGTTLYCVPIAAKSIDMQCAVMEAMCSENYRTVIPVLYNVALKVKYTQDDVSSQVIDIIHDSAITDFIYANNYNINAGVGSLGTLNRTLLGLNAEPSKDFMSKYDSMKEQVGTIVAKLAENAAK
ncbi:MAG: hypothetical protein E7632_08235 [Ruminococcaceae bacterium]|nr:hypothetical protein [Oscillospiraceae bacterium]